MVPESPFALGIPGIVKIENGQPTEDEPAENCGMVEMGEPSTP